MFTIFNIVWVVSCVYAMFNTRHMTNLFKSKGEMYAMIIFGGPLTAVTCMLCKVKYDKDYHKVVHERVTADLGKVVAKYEQFLSEITKEKQEKALRRELAENAHLSKNFDNLLNNDK